MKIYVVYSGHCTEGFMGVNLTKHMGSVYNKHITGGRRDVNVCLRACVQAVLDSAEQAEWIS